MKAKGDQPNPIRFYCKDLDALEITAADVLTRDINIHHLIRACFVNGFPLLMVSKITLERKKNNTEYRPLLDLSFLAMSAKNRLPTFNIIVIDSSRGDTTAASSPTWNAYGAWADFERACQPRASPTTPKPMLIIKKALGQYRLFILSLNAWAKVKWHPGNLPKAWAALENGLRGALDDQRSGNARAFKKIDRVTCRANIVYDTITRQQRRNALSFQLQNKHHQPMPPAGKKKEKYHVSKILDIELTLAMDQTCTFYRVLSHRVQLLDPTIPHLAPKPESKRETEEEITKPSGAHPPSCLGCCNFGQHLPKESSSMDRYFMGTFTKAWLPVLTKGVLIGALSEVPGFDKMGVTSACDRMHLEIYSQSQGKKVWELEQIYQNIQATMSFKEEMDNYIDRQIASRESALKSCLQPWVAQNWQSPEAPNKSIFAS